MCSQEPPVLLIRRQDQLWLRLDQGITFNSFCGDQVKAGAVLKTSPSLIISLSDYFILCETIFKTLSITNRNIVVELVGGGSFINWAYPSSLVCNNFF